VRPLAAAALRLAPGATPRSASNCLWALATLAAAGAADAATDAVRPLAAEAAGRLLGALAPQDVSIVLWALGATGVGDMGLVRPLAGAAVRLAAAGALAVEEVVKCLWALATLGVSDALVAVAAPLGEAALRLAPALSFADAANCLWALATLLEEEEGGAGGGGGGSGGAAGAHRAIVLALAGEATRLAPSAPRAADVATALWAMAKMGVAEAPHLVRPLGEAAVRLAPSFAPTNVANALWALSALEDGPAAAVAAAAAAAARAGLAPLRDIVRPLAEAAQRLLRDGAAFSAKDFAKTKKALTALGARVGDETLAANFQ
jgi:hypothetical protein